MNTTVSNTSTDKVAASDNQSHKLIIASTIGNALEWFDFVVYGFLAVTIAKVFFPTHDDTVALLLTFGTFGISYLFRPLGAILIGWYADKVGRKKALLLSLSLTTIATLIFVLIPGYDTIGYWASACVIIARILLALSAGGEFGSATAMLTEAKTKKKAFVSSWQFASQGLAVTLAALAGFLLNHFLTQEQIVSWGWRLPFLFGLLIAPIGIYIRKNIHDVPVSHHKVVDVVEVETSWKEQFVRCFISMGILCVSTAINYLMLMYMPTYAVKELHFAPTAGFAATLITGIILCIVTPFMGYLADIVGRIKLMVVSTLLLIITIYGAFYWVVQSDSFAVLMIVMIWAGILKATYFSALSLVLSSIFPAPSRARGMNISYSLGTMIFGGFTPFFATLFVSKTHDPLSPSYYLMLCGLLSLVCLIYYQKKCKHYL